MKNLQYLYLSARGVWTCALKHMSILFYTYTEKKGKKEEERQARKQISSFIHHK